MSAAESPEPPETTLLIEEKVYTPPPGGLVIEALTIPLLVESFQATTVEDEMGEQRTAYEVTLKAVLDEGFAAELLRMVRDHKVWAKVTDPDAGRGE